MKVIILCGGKGVRAFPFTEYLPKPMMPVGGTPILMRIIRNFLAQGIDEFILASGYRRSVIEDYFDGKTHSGMIDIVDTGADTDTAERIYNCRDLVRGTFLATYGDGLSDVPIARLLEFHRSHGGLATVTCVPMATQYGVVVSDFAGRVSALREKPTLREYWINAGFLVFERAVFNDWHGRNLEREVLPHLAQLGQLYTYKHDGFFKSMDSYKDQQEFEEIVRTGECPWQVKEAQIKKAS